MRALWRYIQTKDNRDLLTFLGLGLAAVVTAGWAVYTYSSKKEVPDKPQTTPPAASVSAPAPVQLSTPAPNPVSQPPPTLKCLPAETLATFKNKPNISVEAGDGRHIGILSAVSVSIIAKCTPPSSMAYTYEMQYHFYSGNGSQSDTYPNVHLAFKGADGGPLKSDDKALDIGHCVYAPGEDRALTNDVGSVGTLIKEVDISAANRGGRMGKC